LPELEDAERKSESPGEYDLDELVKGRRLVCLLFARTARERREGIGRALRMREFMPFCSMTAAAIDLVAMVYVYAPGGFGANLKCDLV